MQQFPISQRDLCGSLSYKDTTVISKGNALADAATKTMACQPVINTMAVAPDKSSWPDHPRKLYQQNTRNEEEQCRKWEAVEDEGGL